MTSDFDLILRKVRPMGKAESVDVGIQDGIISTVEASIVGRGEKEIESRGQVLIPGFVDTHMHLDKAWMGGSSVWDCITLQDMVMGSIDHFKKYGWKKEEILPRARRAVELGVRKGTTAMRTHVGCNTSNGLAGIEALVELREEVKPWVDIQIIAFSTDGYSGVPDGGENLLREAMSMGVEVVGGTPRIDPDPRPYLDMLFKVAKEYDAELDLHTDESNDPNEIWIELFAEKALEHNWINKTNGSHICSLYWVSEAVADRIIQKMVKAQMRVVTNPLTNLYIRGPNPQLPTGPTRIKDLLDAGLLVAAGSDNTRDFFAPMGNADMLFTTLLLAYQRRISARPVIENMLKMTTVNGAQAMGLTPGYCAGVACSTGAIIVVPSGARLSFQFVRSTSL